MIYMTFWPNISGRPDWPSCPLDALKYLTIATVSLKAYPRFPLTLSRGEQLFGKIVTLSNLFLQVRG